MEPPAQRQPDRDDIEDRDEDVVEGGEDRVDEDIRVQTLLEAPHRYKRRQGDREGNRHGTGRRGHEGKDVELAEGGPPGEKVHDEGEEPHPKGIDEGEDEDPADEGIEGRLIPPYPGLHLPRVEHGGEVPREDTADITPHGQDRGEEGEDPRRNIEERAKEIYEAPREEADDVKGEGQESLD